MECFNEYYVGKIANFMGNVGFIEKRAAKLEKWKAIYFMKNDF